MFHKRVWVGWEDRISIWSKIGRDNYCSLASEIQKLPSSYDHAVELKIIKFRKGYVPTPEDLQLARDSKSKVVEILNNPILKLFQAATPDACQNMHNNLQFSYCVLPTEEVKPITSAGACSDMCVHMHIDDNNMPGDATLVLALLKDKDTSPVHRPHYMDAQTSGHVCKVCDLSFPTQYCLQKHQTKTGHKLKGGHSKCIGLAPLCNPLIHH